MSYLYFYLKIKLFFLYFNFISIRVLPNDKNIASSISWTRYSILNAVVKSKYGINLKQYPRVTALLKSYDTDIKKKAMIFEKEVYFIIVRFHLCKIIFFRISTSFSFILNVEHHTGWSER